MSGKLSSLCFDELLDIFEKAVAISGKGKAIAEFLNKYAETSDIIKGAMKATASIIEAVDELHEREAELIKEEILRRYEELQRKIAAMEEEKAASVEADEVVAEVNKILSQAE